MQHQETELFFKIKEETNVKKEKSNNKKTHFKARSRCPAKKLRNNKKK